LLLKLVQNISGGIYLADRNRTKCYYKRGKQEIKEEKIMVFGRVLIDYTFQPTTDKVAVFVQ